MKNLALFIVNDTNEYQRMIQSDAEAAAKKLGCNLEVFPAQGDAIAQIRQMYACLNRPPETRPQAFLLLPVRDASLERMARDTVGKGITCVLINRRPGYVKELRREFPNVPLGTVGPDQIEVGRIQGNQAKALLPSGGFVLYVMGPALSSAAQDRLTGFREVIKGSPIDFAQIHGNFGEAEGEKAVRDWLKLVMQSAQKLDLVMCQNDAMAIGAKRALETAATSLGRPEFERLPLTGCDGLPHVGQKLVEQGRLTATIIQRPTGGPAVEWAVHALDGQAQPQDVTLPIKSCPEMRPH